MKGYDKYKWRNSSLNLVETHTVNFEDIQDVNQVSQNSVITKEFLAANSLDGLRSLQTRMRTMGGSVQQDRMVFDKRRSLDRALLYSYQAANIRKVQCDHSDRDWGFERENITHMDYDEVCKALINPDKNKMDYDDKILSVPFEQNFHSGDVFEWVGTNTYWMIYLQDLTEIAYFRGEIRRCQYIIEWEDENGPHKTYAAIRGPVETKINYIQKHQVSIDNPNYSLNIYLPKNDETVNYFKRYTKFYLSQVNGEKDPLNVCWRVEATDWISTEGILELSAVEYYANEFEDADGIVGKLIEQPVSPNTPEEDDLIEGEVFIKPKQVYEYYFRGFLGTWSVLEKDFPVEFRIDPNDPRHIKLMWDKTCSGQFTLQNGKVQKVIVVESLF